MKYKTLFFTMTAVFTVGCNASVDSTPDPSGISAPLIDGMPTLGVASPVLMEMPGNSDAEKSAVRAAYENTVVAPALQRILGLYTFDCLSGTRTQSTDAVVYAGCEVATGPERHHVNGTLTLTEPNNSFRMGIELSIAVHDQYGDLVSNRYITGFTVTPTHPKQAGRVNNHHTHQLEVLAGTEDWISRRESFSSVSEHGFTGRMSVEMSDPAIAAIVGYAPFGSGYEAHNTLFGTSTPMAQVHFDNGDLAGELSIQREKNASGSHDYTFARRMSEPSWASMIQLSESNFLEYLNIN